MIGILSKPEEVTSVREFFECFKTPWEFYVPNRSYDVIIATDDKVPALLHATLLVIYNSKRTTCDDKIGAALTGSKCDWLEWNGAEFPVYGDVSVVQAPGRSLLKCKPTAQAVGLEVKKSTHTTIRIGFDLFEEVSFLLSQGQPAKYAHVPTLEMHIALLRTMMEDAGVPFVEIPPVPAGADFMACLTHDVDFVGIRDHKWDATLLGFIYRCFVGSLVNISRGRISWSKLWQNWKAGLSLPLVFLGLREDFWLEFDRFMQIERGLGSTFFFIPFKNYAGTQASGPAPKRRAAKYDFAEIKEHVLDLVKNGCEVGLHGVDAWQDSQKAHSELGRIQAVAGQVETGTRMHWLYWQVSSPQALEGGGLIYDSTFGYNDAVGFRAGTSQAFRPAGAENLLELPLNIQDTAMFYPDRMDLSETMAMDSCKQLIGTLQSFGGALTINWHTRSLSPERLWGDFYIRLLDEIKQYRVRFGTAREIVGWFRERRTLQFERVGFEDDRVSVKVSGIIPGSSSSFQMRVHHPQFGSHTAEFPAQPGRGDSSRSMAGDGLMTISFDQVQFQGAQHV